MPDEILNDISHRRYNPLTGTWLLVSPHRTKRPWQGQQEAPSKNTLPEYDAACYLCPGNKRAQGDRNPSYDSTFAFVNDYSAVKATQDAYTPQPSSDLESRLLRAEATTGTCYVLTFSPKHHLTLADMPAEEILLVVLTWSRIYAAHLAPGHPLSALAADLLRTHPFTQYDRIVRPSTTQLRYMQIFENKGSAMGCSNPHPHCQIWTTSSLPQEPQDELRHMSQYRAAHGGRHLLGDYVQLELEKKERIVYQNAAFLVVCPWWAVWPFEVMILAKKHVRAIVELTAEDRLHFADAIQEVTRRYDNLFETNFPYSSGIHQAPLECFGDEAESSWFHMHFYPPLLRSATVRKFLVGYELLAEPQRDITPEQAAARLRGCGGELYRKRL
ncbi:galactose-1-phosphate uridylyltransferase [Niveomyces insectorum RCEF 264]|uniref:Galactose-1-phosphate uridylyltransferase n=1 Tax=Niveomyces insectorum RCEF 264 TaxID=1081102 RepID=A0A162MT44_9HYPO|nr:galactose-1-phosphate uridylyltransferase [Niveomyces insectorum RCEF 264]